MSRAKVALLALMAVSGGACDGGVSAVAVQEQEVTKPTIIGPPSADLRQNLVAAAKDYLPDLPVVEGSEISDEIALPGAQKLHAVCIRWKSSGPAGDNPPYSPMFVIIVGGWLAQNAWRTDERCEDPGLKFYPFPEMR